MPQPDIRNLESRQRISEVLTQWLQGRVDDFSRGVCHGQEPGACWDWPIRSHGGALSTWMTLPLWHNTISLPYNAGMVQSGSTNGLNVNRAVGGLHNTCCSAIRMIMQDNPTQTNRGFASYHPIHDGPLQPLLKVWCLFNMEQFHNDSVKRKPEGLFVTQVTRKSITKTDPFCRFFFKHSAAKKEKENGVLGLVMKYESIPLLSLSTFVATIH